MKVSFGRIIPVTSISNPDCLNTKKRVDNSTYEVARVLNSEKSTVYSKEEANSIRKFFKSVLGDYNGENGILIRKNEDGDLFLLSGKDAQSLLKREKEQGRKSVTVTNVQGRENKSEIIFSSSKLASSDLTKNQRLGLKPIKTKIDQFQYLRTETYYTAQLDGFIRKDIEPSKKPTITNHCENVVVNYKELIL